MTGVIVHEWIESSGGAEKVLDVMAGTFPDADIMCLWDDAPGRFAADRVHESALARTPLRHRKSLALPFMLPAWRGLDLGERDWMLVSSHLFAHHATIRGHRDVPKFVYAHTPARYIWAPELDQRGDSAAVRLASRPLKAIDRRRAHESASFAANSAFVRQRIRDTWGTDAVVIHPPVEVDALLARADWSTALDEHESAVLTSLPERFVLGASRFVPYKQLDVVIAAGTRAGLPVVIAGSGPEEERLRAAASGLDAHLVIRPSDALLYALYQRAAVFAFPAIEDFGIMPVEAQVLGTPVVVASLGGAQESVEPGVTGVVAAGPSIDQLAEAIGVAAALAPFDGAAHGARFSTERFRTELRDWMGVES